ncbi:MAG: alpha/beta hydrolase-fold protein [Planctomycetota bacterium]|nr:alpha/beta hydrolase-fold protein [Planctomycetota bacterium]
MPRFRTIEVSDPRFEHEGLREITFKSPSLRGRADVTLWLPPGADSMSNLPLVLLLHGVYGSHWAWTRNGGVHRTAARLIETGEIPPMALAMPSDGLWGDGSGYLNHGERFFERYIVDEVPACVRDVAPAVTSQSPVFVCGLSMGGFGALRLGARYPEIFTAISAHSSITHFAQMARFVEEPLAAYGPPPAEEQMLLGIMLANRDRLPAIRFDCGTEDALIEENRQLHRDLTSHDIPHTYEEFPGGHAWTYWETHVADSLRFFGRRPSAPAPHNR